MSAAINKTGLIHRRLYRALLRASKPFCAPSPDAAVLSCLLHRSFIPLEIDESLLQQEDDMETFMPGIYYEDEDDSKGRTGSYPKRSDAHFLLFRRLLHEAFVEPEKDSNVDQNDSQPNKRKRAKCLQWPSEVKDHPLKLQDIIRREFRVPDERTSTEERFSAGFTLQARRDCAFLALRRLNEKLAWVDQLEEDTLKPCPQQSAKNVTPIKLSDPPSSYLKPGTFLLAHPHLSGYFRRSIIAILQHGNSDSKDASKPNSKDENDDNEDNEKEKEEEGEEDGFGTYGIVINRVSLHEYSGKNRTLADVMNILPKELTTAFGGFPVREGGPVHLPSIQMLHACAPPDGGPHRHPCLKEIKGTRLPSVVDPSEKAVYFGGDVLKAAEAVKTEHLDRGEY